VEDFEFGLFALRRERQVLEDVVGEHDSGCVVEWTACAVHSFEQELERRIILAPEGFSSLFRVANLFGDAAFIQLNLFDSVLRILITQFHFSTIIFLVI
jgi:hypothetical protein